MKKFIAAFAMAAAVAGAATAQDVMRLAHVGPPGSLYDKTAAKFTELVNERLGHTVTIETFGASQLGTDKEVRQKLRLGTVELAIFSSIMGSVAPEFAVFEMPYFVKDRDHMKRIEDQIVWPTLAPIAKENNLEILGIWENGYRQITNSKHPVTTPEDLKGLKLRVPSGPWRLRMFQDYGANPTPMSFSEVFVALQTGVIDGQENPLTIIAGSRLNEVQPYLSLSNHVYSPAFLVADSAKWAKLDEATRTALKDIAAEAQAFAYEQAAHDENALLEELKNRGMKVNEVDRDAFVKASQPIYDAFAAEVPLGKELIDLTLSLAAAN